MKKIRWIDLAFMTFAFTFILFAVGVYSVMAIDEYKERLESKQSDALPK